jgi:hypothetical protein
LSRAVRGKRLRTSRTPIRAALRLDSSLQSNVKDGLGAVIATHHVCIHETIRSAFADSVDIDDALKKGREQENRWDYLLGYRPSKQVIGVEPHSAANTEITTVINKLIAARRQLRDHLCDGKCVAKWLWVASGKVNFMPMEKAMFPLAQHGITFVGRTITNKDLARPLQ